MNVLALLDEELKGKNWTDDEKRRYLYLRCGEIFSYDPRYFLCAHFTNGAKMQEDIRNQEIDLENLNSKWVVCTSYAREVYSVLLKELLNTDSDIVGIGHECVVFEDSNGLEVRADGTDAYDLTRIKMGFNTCGYSPVCGTIHAFSNDLRKKDKKLGYLLGDEYANYFIKERASYLYQMFKNSSQFQVGNKIPDDFLICQLKEIEKWVASYQNFEEFSDFTSCISYFYEKFLGCNYGIEPSVIPLYHISNNHWEFVNLYLVGLENDMVYYALARDGANYSYKEISRVDAISYTENYEGKNKSLVFSN